MSWSGADDDGTYRVSSGRLSCADIPPTALRNVRASARGGLLVEDRRGGSVWIAAGGGVTRLPPHGPVRGFTLPSGRVFEYAQRSHGTVRTSVLGASGRLGALDIDFFPQDVTVGWTDRTGGLGVVALVGPPGDRPLGFEFDMRPGATPSALPPISFELCEDDRPVGALARVPYPPLYFDGDDSPFAYAAELDLGEPATCVRRVFTGQGALRVHRGRLVARGFSCTPYVDPRGSGT